MNLNHVEYYEEVHFPTGTRTIQARYRIEREAVTSEGDMELVYDEIRAELTKEMIKDLSGYFTCESFDEKDIEYITTISHGQLERMRKLDKLTKRMSIDEVEKVLHAYEALADLAACGRKGLNHETDR